MNTAIPQLNEDIYQKILEVIVRSKQAELSKLMTEYAGLNLPMMKPCEKAHVEWPELLKSSSQRLVFHDYVPLLNDALLFLPNVCDAKRLIRENCDTMKHVGQIAL